MSKELKLVSPIPVSVNHYLGWRVIMKGGKPIVVSYETPEYKKYKKEFSKEIIKQVREQNWEMDCTGLRHIYVDTIFYFDRIDKDPNNYFKCSLDCITDSKKVWVDDNVVCERVQGILYDSKNPRMEMTIHFTNYIGIFDSIEQLDKFEDKCKLCSRYGRNCSILLKAKSGRIQEEINDFICSKYKMKKEK